MVAASDRSEMEAGLPALVPPGLWLRSRVRDEMRAEVSLWLESCRASCASPPPPPRPLPWPPPPLATAMGCEEAACAMETGLELERLLETWGETEREERRMLPGVPGGVTPLPLALLSPITFTSSLTETPCSSGGMSLLTCGGGGGGGMGRRREGGLAEEPRRDPFSKSFWKNDGFCPGAEDVAAGEGVLLEGEADRAADMERLCLGGGVGFMSSDRLGMPKSTGEFRDIMTPSDLLLVGVGLCCCGTDAPEWAEAPIT